MHFAAGNNHIEIVNLLLKQDGVDVNIVNRFNETPDRDYGVSDEIKKLKNIETKCKFIECVAYGINVLNIILKERSLMIIILYELKCSKNIQS